ncbi:glyoxalase [Streptomyces triticagri]|uniref:Glyoxalase n=1 Tax=Streptomyces triticagri TaxID=2293568 RepID=A0A372MCU5_9ACTN|nr:VOC family protein [Streptomyces triticagri]RFU88739.1 glyoxalase [Streptomyces triticagri]
MDTNEQQTHTNTHTNTQNQTQTQTQTRKPSVWHTLQANDAAALIDFLVDTVGFTRTAVYEDGGLVAHAQLDWPEGGGIMLGSYKEDGWSTPPGTAGAYVVTAQVDALYERVKAAGAKVIREIADQPYGSREFAIVDPEGNKWSFGTYAGELPG